MVYIYIYMKNHCALHEPEEAVVSAANHWRSCWPKNILCVLLVPPPPPVVGTREIIANFISTHQIACWAMAWRRTALVVWRYKKIRGLNLTRSTWQIDRPAVIIYSPDGVPPTNKYLSNVKYDFFFFEKSFRMQLLLILFDVCIYDLLVSSFNKK